VVDLVVPAIKALPPDQRTVDNCIAVNARAQAADIASRGPIIQQAVAAGQIAVVSAVYDIRSGKVKLV
jgi:carbonic anhydrase